MPQARAGRLREEPGILADVEADAAVAEFKDHGSQPGLEDALFVKDAIIREEDLSIHTGHITPAEARRWLKERAAKRKKGKCK